MSLDGHHYDRHHGEQTDAMPSPPSGSGSTCTTVRAIHSHYMGDR